MTPAVARCSLLSFAAVVLSVVFAAGAAVAQETDVAKKQKLPERPVVIGVRAGIDGAYKLGCWTPVELEILAGPKSEAGELVLATPDGDGVACSYPPVAVQLTAGRTVRVVGYVRFGKPDPELKVALRTPTDGLLEDRFTTDQFDGRPHIDYPLAAGDRLIVALGRSSTLRQVAELAARNNQQEQKLEIAQLEYALQLPTRSAALEAADAVVIYADQLDRFATLTADSAQAAALREYLQFGGRVIVVAGRDAPALLGPKGPLASIAGLKTGAPVPLPRAAALEGFVGGNKPLGVKTASLGELRIPRVDEPAAVVHLAEGDLPLVVRKAVGFGAATWVMVDLEHALLQDWSGRPLMLATLLEGPLGSLEIEKQSADGNTWGPYYGFNDLAGQLHQAVDQYAGVRSVPFFALAMLVLVYIALIGPGDYFLVRRLLKRTELTWITFPTIVVVTSIAAYFAAIWLKGDQLRVNQVDLVDVDAESGLVHGSTFAGVFSPVSRAYDLSATAPSSLVSGKLEDLKQTTAWFGSPGEGLGGMHRRDMAPGWFSSSYEIKPDLSTLVGSPIKVWSSKLFAGDWRGRGAGSLHATLTEVADGRLSGTLKNVLRVPTEGGFLCYKTTAFEVPSLAPGETIEIRSLTDRDLKGLLANAQIMERKQRELSPGMRLQTHDTSTLDAGVILTKIMFFQALGSEEHSRLNNDELAELDFSELLNLRRAVYVAPVGKADAAALPQFHVADAGADVAREHDLHRTIVRLSIPVELAK